MGWGIRRDGNITELLVNIGPETSPLGMSEEHSLATDNRRSV